MKRNKIFLFLILSSSILILSIPFRKLNTFSVLENRSLTEMPTLSSESFNDKTFQDDFQEFLNDHILFGEETRIAYGDLKHSMNNYIYGKLPKPETYEYMLYNSGIYRYGDFDYLVFKPSEPLNFKGKELFVSTYNRLIEENPSVDFYAYYIPTSSSINFKTDQFDAFQRYLLETLDVKDFQALPVQSFEEYQQYFYKTDHHWNYEGSYVGYKAIISMMKNEEALVPYNTTCFNDLDFQGANARFTTMFDFHETFCVYDFDKSDNLTVYSNGNLGSYGNEKDYRAGIYNTKIGTNHYGYFYGGDDGELIFENPERNGNLLVLGTSFDNAINELLAQHYGMTYIIDQRNYENDLGKPFDLTSYLVEKEIDQVLLIGDHWFYTLEEAIE